MYKLVWAIVGFCVFLGVTLGALTAKNLHYGKQVKFVNVNLAVRNSNSEVINKTVTIPSQVVTQNTTLTTTTASNSVNTDNSTVSYKTTDYSTTNSSTRNNTYTKKYQYDNTPLNYKNIDDTELDKVLNNTSTYKTNKTTTNRNNSYNKVPKYNTANNTANNAPNPAGPEYGYDDIDWSKWKSNFVNRILDDSLYITELDKYPSGAFFYYSFIVDYEGRISNVSVRSVYLSDADKKIVADFIRRYAHTPITRFPAKSNRKTARISAIMMLSSTETIHSKPSDFNDMERIKYQIK